MFEEEIKLIRAANGWVVILPVYINEDEGVYDTGRVQNFTTHVFTDYKKALEFLAYTIAEYEDGIKEIEKEEK